MRTFLKLAVLCGVLAVPGSALAAATTVDGKGDIKSMKVVNGDTAVQVTVKGLKALCGGTQNLNLQISWGTKAAYEAGGICVSGQWSKGLFYRSSAADPETAKSQPCGKLRVVYADGAVRVRVPRSCIKKAGNRIRVRAEGQNYGTMTGGTAGPTKLLRRG